MQVVGDFHFANSSATDEVVIPKAFLVVHFLRWRLIPARLKVESTIGVKSQSSDIYGPYPIPPRGTTTGRAMWLIEPPLLKPPHRRRAKAGFVDQFGSEHWTPILNCKYL
jgi:hypothetical protein